MSSLSKLNQVRGLLGASSSETAAYHGTSVEMIAHLAQTGEVVAPEIEMGTDNRRAIRIIPTLECMKRVLEDNRLDIDQVLHIDDYDELEVVSSGLGHEASHHRLNVFFGEPLGTYMDTGDVLKLDPTPNLEGNLHKLFADNSGEQFYSWLHAVMSEDRMRDLMYEFYHERFGVVVGLRESVLEKLEAPKPVDLRFMAGDGLFLRRDAAIEIDDIVNIHPLGKADRNDLAGLLGAPGIKVSP